MHSNVFITYLVLAALAFETGELTSITFIIVKSYGLSYVDDFEGKSLVFSKVWFIFSIKGAKEAVQVSLLYFISLVIIPGSA